MTHESIDSCQVYLSFQNRYLTPENPRWAFPNGQLNPLAMQEPHPGAK